MGAPGSGDVNNDGVANIVDALMIARHLDGAEPAGVFDVDAADVDNDGVITAADADRIATGTVGVEQVAVRHTHDQPDMAVEVRQPVFIDRNPVVESQPGPVSMSPDAAMALAAGMRASRDEFLNAAELIGQAVRLSWIDPAISHHVHDHADRMIRASIELEQRVADAVGLSIDDLLDSMRLPSAPAPVGLSPPVAGPNPVRPVINPAGRLLGRWPTWPQHVMPLWQAGITHVTWGRLAEALPIDVPVPTLDFLLDVEAAFAILNPGFVGVVPLDAVGDLWAPDTLPVVEGDSLVAIARARGISVGDLVKMNEHRYADLGSTFSPGMVLVVPGLDFALDRVGPSDVADDEPGGVAVAPGSAPGPGPELKRPEHPLGARVINSSTFRGAQAAYGTITVTAEQLAVTGGFVVPGLASQELLDDLAAAIAMLNPHLDEIPIRGSGALVWVPTVHVVAIGESLAGLAHQAGVSIDELVALNRSAHPALGADFVLTPGQRLVIPAVFDGFIRGGAPIEPTPPAVVATYPTGALLEELSFLTIQLAHDLGLGTGDVISAEVLVTGQGFGIPDDASPELLADMAAAIRALNPQRTVFPVGEKWRVWMPRVHVVAVGESLAALAYQAGVSVEEVVAFNQQAHPTLGDDFVLSAGDRIVLPRLIDGFVRPGAPAVETPVVQQPVSPVAWVEGASVVGVSLLARGAAIASIRDLAESAYFGYFGPLTRERVDDLAAALELMNPHLGDRFSVGDNSIWLPIIHRVREGESLSELAHQAGVSIEELVAMNRAVHPDLADDFVLTPGQRLVMPSTEMGFVRDGTPMIATPPARDIVPVPPTYSFVGVLQGDDGPAADVVVCASGDDGELLQCATTDGLGRFSFDGLVSTEVGLALPAHDGVFELIDRSVDAHLPDAGQTTVVRVASLPWRFVTAPGESLAKIAALFGVTVAEARSWMLVTMSVGDDDALPRGMVLLIPAGVSPAAPAPEVVEPAAPAEPDPVPPADVAPPVVEVTQAGPTSFYVGHERVEGAEVEMQVRVHGWGGSPWQTVTPDADGVTFVDRAGWGMADWVEVKTTYRWADGRTESVISDAMVGNTDPSSAHYRAILDFEGDDPLTAWPSETGHIYVNLPAVTDASMPASISHYEVRVDGQPVESLGAKLTFGFDTVLDSGSVVAGLATDGLWIWGLGPGWYRIDVSAVRFDGRSVSLSSDFYVEQWSSLDDPPRLKPEVPGNAGSFYVPTIRVPDPAPAPPPVSKSSPVVSVPGGVVPSPPPAASTPVDGGGLVAAFTAAIRELESSSRYAIGPMAAGGPSGAYQFMQETWARAIRTYAPSYASYASMPAFQAPAAVQDAVATLWFAGLFERFGDWDLVAIAHFAGEGTADAVLGGVDVSAMSDSLGTSVAEYLRRVDALMGGARVAPVTAPSTLSAVQRVIVDEVDRLAGEVRFYVGSFDNPLGDAYVSQAYVGAVEALHAELRRYVTPVQAQRLVAVLVDDGLRAEAAFEAVLGGVPESVGDAAVAAERVPIAILDGPVDDFERIDFLAELVGRGELSPFDVDAAIRELSGLVNSFFGGVRERLVMRGLVAAGWSGRDAFAVTSVWAGLGPGLSAEELVGGADRLHGTYLNALSGGPEGFAPIDRDSAARWLFDQAFPPVADAPEIGAIALGLVRADLVALQSGDDLALWLLQIIAPLDALRALVGDLASPDRWDLSIEVARAVRALRNAIAEVGADYVVYPSQRQAWEGVESVAGAYWDRWLLDVAERWRRCAALPDTASDAVLAEAIDFLGAVLDVSSAGVVGRVDLGDWGLAGVTTVDALVGLRERLMAEQVGRFDGYADPPSMREVFDRFYGGDAAAVEEAVSVLVALMDADVRGLFARLDPSTGSSAFTWQLVSQIAALDSPSAQLPADVSVHANASTLASWWPSDSSVTAAQLWSIARQLVEHPAVFALLSGAADGTEVLRLDPRSGSVDLGALERPNGISDTISERDIAGYLQAMQQRWVIFDDLDVIDAVRGGDPDQTLSAADFEQYLALHGHELPVAVREQLMVAVESGLADLGGWERVLSVVEFTGLVVGVAGLAVLPFSAPLALALGVAGAGLSSVEFAAALAIGDREQAAWALIGTALSTGDLLAAARRGSAEITQWFATRRITIDPTEADELADLVAGDSEMFRMVLAQAEDVAAGFQVKHPSGTFGDVVFDGKGKGISVDVAKMFEATNVSYSPLLSDPVVQAAMAEAWRESVHLMSWYEQGGWIVRKRNGSYDVVRWPRGTHNTITPPSHPPRNAVAEFHTHPKRKEQGGVAQPSDADLRRAERYPGMEHFVISHEGIYAFTGSNSYKLFGSVDGS